MRTPLKDIRAALEGHLAANLETAGVSPQSVAWQNVLFTPVDGVAYLRPTLLLNRTVTASLGPDGFERIQGIFQVDVFSPLSGGPGAAEEIAAGIVDAFRGGTALACGNAVAEISVAHCGTGRADNDRFHVPVSVYWRCYAQK